MRGWHISVYRLEEVDPVRDRLPRREAPSEQTLRAAAETRADRIAAWQAGVRGPDWIDELVAHGHAIAVPGNGHPDQYFAPARHLLAPVLEGPADAKATWSHDPGDVLLPNWEEKTAIDRAVATSRAPDEWLLVKAGDER